MPAHGRSSGSRLELGTGEHEGAAAGGTRGPRAGAAQRPERDGRCLGERDGRRAKEHGVGGAVTVARWVRGWHERAHERAGPRERRKGDHDGLGTNDECRGCFGEWATERIDMERLLDGDFCFFYLSN